jgi:hypothetical protein
MKVAGSGWRAAARWEKSTPDGAEIATVPLREIGK